MSSFHSEVKLASWLSQHSLLWASLLLLPLAKPQGYLCAAALAQFHSHILCSPPPL